MQKNVVSMSGGKDSTATALLALEREAEGLHLVFADTGHEHPQTYEYVDYLRGKLGHPIDTVRADFSAQIAGKREFIAANWREHGVPEAQVLAALDVLQPTGIPFLDLCLWKGRFPSTRARFCSEKLKHEPLNEYMETHVLAGCATVISWQGVRADESADRAQLDEKDVEFGQWEPKPVGHLIYRPILKWTAEDVFAQHDRHGVKPNPLYRQGMGRVGCMPCIHARKDELRQIAQRFPEEIARVAEWEKLVSAAAKRGVSTFMDIRPVLKMLGEEYALADVDLDRHGIAGAVKWSRTKRGGSIPMQEDAPATCSSIYGLCE